MSKSVFDMVVASTLEGGIGRRNQLPWRLPRDLGFFKQLTSSHVIVMGRKTWESLKVKPLPNRENVVISTTLTRVEGATLLGSLDEAMQWRESESKGKKLFVIGGRRLFEEGAAHPGCREVFRTRVAQNVECDTFIPCDLFGGFRLLQTSRTYAENGLNFDFQRLVNPLNAGQEDALSPIESRSEEMQYLDLVGRIIGEGSKKEDRTGTGTLSLFGNSMRYNLQESFPLLTTKRVFFRGVAEELFWFMRGQTDGRVLLEKKVRIWEGNGSREYLDSIGLQEREEQQGQGEGIFLSDLGPIYGFQWRHFGARYQGRDSDYEGQGVDQLRRIEEQIRTDPHSRRIILSAWNPLDLREMALPPCHVMCQFFVHDGRLSCAMYQRSCDVGLGVPFNIASYSLLTVLLAKSWYVLCLLLSLPPQRLGAWRVRALHGRHARVQQPRGAAEGAEREGAVPLPHPQGQAQEGPRVGVRHRRPRGARVQHPPGHQDEDGRVSYTRYLTNQLSITPQPPSIASAPPSPSAHSPSPASPAPLVNTLTHLLPDPLHLGLLELARVEVPKSLLLALDLQSPLRLQLLQHVPHYDLRPPLHLVVHSAIVLTV